MNIFHYSLGFPPYRSGGLTKFCMDLMEQQIKDGHTVSLLWPGAYSIVYKKTKIKKQKSIKKIGSYEVINPNPVPYDEGINEINEFTHLGTKGEYDKFLSVVKPDVIHIHTLMGLHANLVIVAKEKGIRLVFTTHDFFPICPKVTMYRDGKVCNYINLCDKCGSCNSTALSINKIKILQSPLYRGLKDSHIVKRMRKGHRDSYFREEISDDKEDNINSSTGAEKYLELRGYYKDILEKMSVIHYNSTLTKQVFNRFMNVEKPESKVINISHSDIADHRRIKDFGKLLRLTYLGPYMGAKGFFI